uniref:Larval cement protein 3 n=1 Tax=Megabalanus rosa TaxID=6680 RepID=A0A8D5RT35_MEGRO|nr:larval cement protein 3 [Megabalanus rosa]
MLREFLLSCLAAGAVATYSRVSPVGGSFYGSVVRPTHPIIGTTVPATSLLDGLLLPADISPAIRLIRTRYGSLSRLAAIDVLRIFLSRPHPLLLQSLQLRSVPVVAERLGFLRRAITALPPVFYNGGYSSAVATYIRQLGISVTSSALVSPLALIDARLACSWIAPVSVPTFVDFFGNRILQLGGGQLVGGLPPLETFYNRLTSLRFTPVPVGFQRVSIVAPTVVRTLRPAFTRLGLTGMVQPNIVFRGLAAYLSRQGLKLPQFVGGLTHLQIPPISSLIQDVPFDSLLPRLRFLPATVIRQDIVPLLAVRFRTLPRRLVRTLHLRRVIVGYLSTLEITKEVTFSPGYISTLLNGFDRYILRQAKGFKGRLWCHSIWGDW